MLDILLPLCCHFCGKWEEAQNIVSPKMKEIKQYSQMVLLFQIYPQQALFLDVSIFVCFFVLPTFVSRLLKCVFQKNAWDSLSLTSVIAAILLKQKMGVNISFYPTMNVSQYWDIDIDYPYSFTNWMEQGLVDIHLEMWPLHFGLFKLLFFNFGEDLPFLVLNTYSIITFTGQTNKL